MNSNKLNSSNKNTETTSAKKYFSFKKLALPLIISVVLLFLFLLVFSDKQKFFPTEIKILQKKLQNHNYKKQDTKHKMKKIATSIFKPEWKNEGVGAKVIRVVGNQYLKRLDPFLLLDYFHVKLPAGFPDHPHRGFETVTYMLEGQMAHEDFKGHKGIIGPGDIQWMTAGMGIVHSQMPTSFQVTSKGFQLWLNLKAENKMIPPRYQQLKSSQIPVIKKEEKTVKVIAGEWQNVKGPIKVQTPAVYFDIHFHQKTSFNIEIQQTWNSIVFVYDGQLTYTDQQKQHLIEKDNCVRLSNGLKLQSFKGDSAKFIVIAGQPIAQPIQQYGPFVMTTQKQLNEARRDYQYAKNGFQGTHEWQSKIRHLAEKK